MLTPEGKIDEVSLVKMLEWTGDMQVTFHRAFDELEDQFEGRTLQKYRSVTRVLTSGGPRLHRKPSREFGSSWNIRKEASLKYWQAMA